MRHVYRMETTPGFTLKSGVLGTSILGLAKSEEYDLLDIAIRHAEIVEQKLFDMSSYAEIRQLFKVLFENDRKDLEQKYFVELERICLKYKDYNGLVALWEQNIHRIGRTLSPEAMEVINNFHWFIMTANEVLEKTLNSQYVPMFDFRKDSVVAKDDDGHKVGEIDVFVRGRALYFEYDGVIYRVFWLDD